MQIIEFIDETVLAVKLCTLHKTHVKKKSLCIHYFLMEQPLWVFNEVALNWLFVCRRWSELQTGWTNRHIAKKLNFKMTEYQLERNSLIDCISFSLRNYVYNIKHNVVLKLLTFGFRVQIFELPESVQLLYI